MANYLNLEQVLPEGRHQIRVFKSEEYSESEQRYLKGTHRRTRPNKNGVIGYIYNTDVKYLDGDKERRCNVFAYDEKKKKLFDGGEVEVNIIPKLVGGEEVFKKLPNGDFQKELTAFFNPVRPTPNADQENDPFKKVPEYNNPGFVKEKKPTKEKLEDFKATVEEVPFGSRMPEFEEGKEPIFDPETNEPLE